MKVINYTDLRLNLKKWLDSVTDDMEEVLITRKDKKNLVVISQDEYNSLSETNYLLSGKNRDIILKSLEQSKSNKIVVKEIDL